MKVELIGYPTEQDWLECQREEEWRPIKGYPGYEVSSFGRVRSFVGWKRRGSAIPKILTPGKSRGGYLHITLCGEETRSTADLHRLVAEAFLPNLNNLPQVNHIDGDKTNNCVWNLEWATIGENISHAWQSGLREHTQKQRQSVIDRCAKRVSQYTIDGDYVATYRSASEAERDIGICHAAISAACRGKQKAAGGFVWRFTNES